MKNELRTQKWSKTERMMRTYEGSGANVQILKLFHGFRVRIAESAAFGADQRLPKCEAVRGGVFRDMRGKSILE